MVVHITRLNGMHVVSEMQYMQGKTAEVAYQLGCREMCVYYYNAGAEKNEQVHVRVDGIIAGISAGDIVVCQFPTWNGIKFERILIEHIKAYHGHVVIMIHDFEPLMEECWRGKIQETVELYNQADVLIVPSYALKGFLLENGIRENMKFVIQEIFDYPTDIYFTPASGLKKEIHFTGSPGRFVFPNQWDHDIPLKVYSDEICTGKNIRRMRWMNPSELLLELAKGGFGLLWYKDENWHQYMRYNSSANLSTYLAAGIPVIVPRGISNQYLIEGNHLGLIVDSLEEAVEKVKKLTEKEYQEYVRNVGKFAILLRSGYFTRKILTEAVHAVCRKDIGSGASSNQICNLADYAFLSTTLNESYGGNLALSWNFKGKPDGFLIYDSTGALVEETDNIYQHYLLIKNRRREDCFIIKAYVNTLKGKLIVAESELIRLNMQFYRKPLVSLIVPAYNADKFISRSIDTALAQSFPDLEIIIVNDGSTDETQAIIEWYKQRYPQVMSFYQSNGGQALARNTGVVHAEGEYVGFLDSDDMVRPDMIERLYGTIRKNGCDIAIGSAYMLTNAGYKKIIDYPVAKDSEVSSDEFFECFINNNYPVVWNKLYRTSLVKEHLFPKMTYEDAAWMPYILSYAKNICYIDECLYEYDRTIRNVTAYVTARKKSVEEIYVDHRDFLMFYLEKGNPLKRSLLKRLAIRTIESWIRTFSLPQYDELKKTVEQS